MSAAPQTLAADCAHRADLLAWNGKPDEARPLYLQAAKHAEEALAETPDTMPATQRVLRADIVKWRGKLATECANKADELLMQARALFREAADHAEVALAATPADKPKTRDVYRSNAAMLRIKGSR